MRVADYLADAIYQSGVEDIFIVTGGGLMFLTDGVACHPLLRAVPCLHEQAAAMAAISYAQYREGYGACYVTTGCGGANAVTGVLHAWQDHAPVIYVSGQCNRNEMMSSVKSKVRQIGLQEADIVGIVGSITKYAVTIMEAEDAVYEIGKALYLARSGSPGPVWLDIPLDIQEAEIDPERCRCFLPDEDEIKTAPTKDEIEYVVSCLQDAERPIIIMGQGVRLAGAKDLLCGWIEKNHIPVVGTRMGWDCYPNNRPLHIGLADIRGTRAANFAVQNADVVLCLGTRLSVMTTGYNYSLFAREAKKVIVVDIDTEEHKKNTVRIDRVVHADIKNFLREMPELKMKDMCGWNKKCLHWKKIWPVFNQEQDNDINGISKFAFCRILNERLKDDSVVITDAGATTEIPMQSLSFDSARQRYLGSGAQCEMGYALPATVGASIASGKKEAICIVGDGSLQMNIQELQTLVTQGLPAKIFVWNNGGYATIRGHQKTIFKGRYLGVDAETGTAFPNLEKIAAAYGIMYYRADRLADLARCMDSIFQQDRPVICEVMCWKEEINPQVKAKMRREDGQRVALPIEDMYPLIPREELLREMIVEAITWWKIG